MAQHTLWRLAVFSVWFIGNVSVADAASEVAGIDV
jgi:hypothetical protein